ncbi:MAG: C39 family peptidase, partial [Chloroflexota bacterium]
PGSPTAVAGMAGAGGTATPISLSVVTASRTPSPVATRRPAIGATARVVSPLLTPILKPLPASRLLQNDYQVYETWNNCGPASLSMALSYFGINQSQAALGEALRPYQNSVGDNDDKDVTMEELAAEARKFGLLAYYRPNGNVRLLKEFVALGVPVIAETVMTMDDDIGHYRVVKGYDDAAGTITQDDSMQGHNVQFSYADFDYMWKKYNYEYLVLAPKDKQRQAEAILGKNLNPKAAWQATAAMDRAMLVRDPADVDSGFNLSVALYYLGKYRQSVREFEAVQSRLPARTLWYQIEPIEAYYALGDYQTVISLSNQVLNSGDRAFSQLYILLGEIDKKQGNTQAARAEFQNAVFYNTNLKAAREALRSVS